MAVNTKEGLVNGAKGEEDSRIDENPSTGFTFWLVYTTAVCVIGSSFQFGYNLAVINAPEEVIKAYFRSCGTFSDFEWAVSVAIFAVGGMCGALSGPAAANIFGRKRTLWFNNFLAILGGLMMSLSRVASTPEILTMGRLIIGINCGINTAVVPIYLSEIAPIQLRGSLGTLNQFGIVSGILIAQILGIKRILGNESGWPFLLGLPVAPAVVQLLALSVCPRSPRYLLLKLQNEEQAQQALYRLRGTTFVSTDIAEMEEEQEKERGLEKVSVLQLFTRTDLRMPLLISVVLQMSQQFSGINGVFYYSTSIFNLVGVKNSDAATCGVGVVSVVMTAIVVRLVEMKGRRTLLLWGLGGMVIFYTIMTISFALQHKVTWFSFVSVVATLLLIVFFQFGPGPIPWFITAELFAQGSRDAAVSVAGTVNWLGSFVVGLTFPSLQKSLHPYTFVLFVVLVALFWLFTWFVVPETKGRAIEDIAEAFREKSANDPLAPFKESETTEL